MKKTKEKKSRKKENRTKLHPHYKDINHFMQLRRI